MIRLSLKDKCALKQEVITFKNITTLTQQFHDDDSQIDLVSGLLLHNSIFQDIHFIIEYLS